MEGMTLAIPLWHMIHDRSYEAWVEAEADALDKEQSWLAFGAMRAEAEANAMNADNTNAPLDNPHRD